MYWFYSSIIFHHEYNHITTSAPVCFVFHSPQIQVNMNAEILTVRNIGINLFKKILINLILKKFSQELCRSFSTSEKAWMPCWGWSWFLPFNTFYFQFRTSDNTPSLTCFQKDRNPVDLEEIFEEHCEDIHGNKYEENSETFSCCECMM